ncbi:hypothetical protein [Pseudomonas sp. S2_B07]
MQVSMLTEREATQTLKRLVQQCTRYDVAVAWAGANKVVDTMLDSTEKLRKVVIGTHMYQTDPAVLRRFMPFDGARCLPPSGRLFHPKIYLFEMPKGIAAVVGSHNLTGGAFGGRNVEVSVLLHGDEGSEVLADLKSFIDSSWSSAERISEDGFLFSYEAQYLANKGKLAQLEKFNRLKKPRPGAKTSPLALTWSKFVEGVKNDGNHNLVGRLAILEQAALLFAESGTFANMSLLERKAISGTYGSKEPRLSNLDWAWFGNMVGQGDFKSLVNRTPRLLSAALDHIPVEGDVSEEQFQAFVRDFDRAFRNKTHKGGVATASRLLVMKRPDFFVGVNRANRTGICDAFGVAHTTLSLENYWERIVIPMQSSPWWLQARPRGKSAARIWDNRAALLDSIYYEPI